MFLLSYEKSAVKVVLKTSTHTKSEGGKKGIFISVTKKKIVGSKHSRHFSTMEKQSRLSSLIDTLDYCLLTVKCPEVEPWPIWLRGTAPCSEHKSESDVGSSHCAGIKHISDKLGVSCTGGKCPPAPPCATLLVPDLNL